MTNFCSRVVAGSVLALAMSLAPCAGLAQDARPGRPGFAGPRARGPIHPNRELMLERWLHMTPEERQRALEKLPPQRRERIEQQLRRYQAMSPEERERVRARMEAWEKLPPEAREQRRELFRRFVSLPENRRPLVRRELNYLRNLPEAERSARLSSEAFRNRYSADEQRLLRDLSDSLAER